MKIIKQKIDFKRKLLNEKGAMDRILVTLLLIIVGVSAVIGLSSWTNTQSSKVKNSAANVIQSANNDASR